MSLLGLLIAIVIFGAFYWAATRLMKAFGIGDPIYTVIVVIIVLVGLLWLAGQFGYGPGLNLRL